MTDNIGFDLSQEGQAIWNKNAPFWDEHMGEGNDFQRVLVGPATERLLQVQKGEQVLDIACGNGNFARRLADLGAQVTGFDFSEEFIERARRRSMRFGDRITYHVIDATQRDQLLGLGRQRFDAAVSNMALMDMAAIEPLFDSLRELLKPDGRFVFSVMHPCFNSMGTTKLIEEEDQDGDLVMRYSMRINGYLTPTVTRGLGVIGQPESHYYFHRPISLLFRHAFQAGFILDGFEEPAFQGEVQANRPFSWVNFPEIPPVMVARLRCPG